MIALTADGDRRGRNDVPNDSTADLGFSDDEVTKLRAVQAYSRGEFAVNAEHPMLMKAAIWGSVRAAEGWNRLTPDRYHLPLEAALRSQTRSSARLPY